MGSASGHAVPADLTLVPPLRLGDLLAAHRLRDARALDEVAASSPFTRAELVLVEAGRRLLTDDEIAAVVSAYGLGPTEVLPQRVALEVDRREGELRIGSAARPLDPAADVDQVLARYLSLLEVVRGVELQTTSPLRAPDMAILSDALETSVREIEQRLAALLLPGARDDVRQSLLGRLAVPAAGFLVGLTAVGALVLLPLPGGQRPTLVDARPRPQEESLGVPAGRTDAPILIVRAIPG